MFPGVFVGVDELMELKMIGAVFQVVSKRGVVATEYYKTEKNFCHVFVTSLKYNAFYTASGRAVITWTPEHLQKGSRKILEHYLNGCQLKDLKPFLIDSAGFHF